MVTFYKINDDGTPGDPVLFLDTLKVSTIEQTAETADARGGKGNPKLISWDYGKEITVTIEDALFSPKSMAVMFGNGSVDASDSTSLDKATVIRATSTVSKLPSYFTIDVAGSDGNTSRKKVYMDSATHNDGVAYGSSGVTLQKMTTATGSSFVNFATLTTAESVITAWNAVASATKGEKYFLTYKIGASTKTITISADSFPGTYYVTGDTYARSDVTGNDQMFQFVIPKAKMTAENTITLEAEGDPSVFNMNLTVLRPEDGEMMKLIQYDLIAG